MSLRLYNSLTRRLEDFHPLREGEVRMYTCGPTVYHFVHIGNFRTFLFQDILRRHLLYKGYRLLHVMNITDVEDKIIAAARSQRVSISEYTKRFEAAFLEDMETLRIQRPEVMPRATEHIEEMIELVRRLEEGGYTYSGDGSTYFRIDRFPDYGKLSGIEEDVARAPSAAGRIDDDEYGKENPRDFVLWKAGREGERWWDSPFGNGRPGWHLECSAMSMKYLGESFDIHCGGVDLVFPHHENEVAQSEAATGKPFVRYWLHAAHLIVDGQKMSKSLGNFHTLRDLLDRGCQARALRYLLTSVHYRKQLNFTFEGVEQAEAAIRRVEDFLIRVREVKDDAVGREPLTAVVSGARRGFENALDDDLNVSAALAALFELIREVNPLLEQGRVGAADRDRILGLFRDVDRIFDVFQVEARPSADPEILRLIEERERARTDRDYRRADEIRDVLLAQGISLEDTREGTRWKKRS
jgi:cysteinyl-tRNA synthetase